MGKPEEPSLNLPPQNSETPPSENANVYTDSIAEWYDRIIESNYYEHEKAAESLDKVLRGRNKILEIGVGTGLLAEKMIKRGYDVTGVDFTPAMLKVAKERLGESAKLYEQNVLRLQLPEKYEAIFSEGGVWVMTRDSEGNLFMESHIPDAEGNFAGMKKVIQVLEKDGLLVLGIQSVHADIDAMELKDGAVYSQKVKYELPLIDKEYFVTKDGKTVAHQHSKYRRLDDEERARILQENGLVEVGMDESGLFMILKKVNE